MGKFVGKDVFAMESFLSFMVVSKTGKYANIKKGEYYTAIGVDGLKLDSTKLFIKAGEVGSIYPAKDFLYLCKLETCVNAFIWINEGNVKPVITIPDKMKIQREEDDKFVTTYNGKTAVYKSLNDILLPYGLTKANWAYCLEFE